MWPLSLSEKNTSSSSTTTAIHESGTVAAAKSVASSSTTCHCCCVVTKLMRKLKRVRSRRTVSRQSSFQCRYDPLSYSLNFDTTGCGGSLLDEDNYYEFYAFSSRFVANPRPTSSPILQLAAGKGNSH